MCIEISHPAETRLLSRLLWCCSDLDLKPRPPVGIIPLGTGNGMSCNLVSAPPGSHSSSFLLVYLSSCLSMSVASPGQSDCQQACCLAITPLGTSNGTSYNLASASIGSESYHDSLQSCRNPEMWS